MRQIHSNSVYDRHCFSDRTVPRTKPAMATNASIRARAPPPDRFAVLVLDATHVITELCALVRLARMAILWLNVDRLLEAKFS